MLPSNLGHYFGAKNATDVVEWCLDLGIETLTVYVFSTENFERPKEEVESILSLIEDKLRELSVDDRIRSHEVRIKALGKVEILPKSLQDLLSEMEKATSSYNRHFLNIAIAYGGRAEILEVMKEIAEEVKEGRITPGEITSETIERHLYTSHLPNPDPDLIIRTSGEERLSGFLIWQSAYSELVFLDVYWPDFRKIDLMRAIRTYQHRTRKFGK
jgi:tritrans,polycis-undecaprenyl-diphosphate synthase [geranylgeranyl-diphosphate specific]